MCGIFGMFSKNEDIKINQAFTGLMSLRHRGPDAWGLATFKEGGNHRIFDSLTEVKKDKNLDINNFLGHVRLSIIDLSRQGNQPMHFSLDGEEYWIVFNGEIYNYIEIREELSEKGYKFNTESDTEVLLKSYIEYKESCLNKLNGMFSFAIYEEKSGRLFIARDRMGKKPLYYIHEKGRFSFSSEIKSFVMSEIADLIFKKDWVYYYLMYGWNFISPKETFYQNIHVLPGGHYLILQRNNLTIKKWWNPEINEKNEDNNLEKDEEKIKNKLMNSVKLRLRSDVPVGMSLSGGIDSSSILWAINNIKNNSSDNNKIHVFTAIRKDEKNSEKQNVLKTLNFLSGENVTPHFIEIENIKMDDILDFCYLHDEPVRDAFVMNQYLVMKEVSNNGIKVLLNGQGPDEIFFGYESYFLNFAIYDLKRLDFIGFLKKFSNYSKRYGLLSAFKSIINLIIPGRVLKAIYRRNKEWMKDFTFRVKEVKRIHKNFFSNDLKKLQRLDLFNWRLPYLLRDEDKNSMRFSIETRLPYLDFNFIESNSSNLRKTDYLMNENYTKPIIRNAFSGLLPEEVVWQNYKKGFYEKIYHHIDDFIDLSIRHIRESKKIKDFVDVDDLIKKVNRDKDMGLLWRTLNLALLLDQEKYRLFHMDKIDSIIENHD